VAGILFKAASTLDSMVGYRNERYREFGWAAARLDDLLNWLPARLTALCMVVASSPLGLDPHGAWRIMCRDARKHASPNAGIPEAPLPARSACSSAARPAISGVAGAADLRRCGAGADDR